MIARIARKAKVSSEGILPLPSHMGHTFIIDSARPCWTFLRVISIRPS